MQFALVGAPCAFVRSHCHLLRKVPTHLQLKAFTPQFQLERKSAQNWFKSGGATLPTTCLATQVVRNKQKRFFNSCRGGAVVLFFFVGFGQIQAQNIPPNDQASQSRSILTRSLQAMGGADQWTKVCSVQTNGSVTTSGRTPHASNIVWMDALSNALWQHRRTNVDPSSNGVPRQLDEKSLINVRFKNKVYKMPAPDSTVSLLPHLPALSIVRILGSSQYSTMLLATDSQDLTGVRVFKNGIPDQEWWFTKANSLPTTVETRLADPLTPSNQVWQTIKFSSFQTSMGLVLPSAVVVSLGQVQSNQYAFQSRVLGKYTSGSSSCTEDAQ